MSARDQAALASELRALEELHQGPRVRASPSELAALLADDFSEFGASGRCYDRRAVLEMLPLETPRGAFRIEDFRVRSLGESCALAAYSVLREFAAGDQPAERSLRSSIWERSPSGWRLVFHQGTASGVSA